MLGKDFIRSRYILKRKKNYKKIEIKFFNPLIKLLKKKKYTIKNIGIYYPSNFELDILKILDILYFKKFNFLLPVINSKQNMNFYKWKKNDILFVNEHGFLEPFKSKKVTPDALIVPLLAFDKFKNRLGYGKGYYDKFLNDQKKILSIGVAFSFQKYHKLPVNIRDHKLDFIITEKGIE